jgi:bacterial/archaeal transporter family-2 protein
MGAGLQVQAGVNSRLAHFLGSPLRAATISFLVGFVALFLVSLVATRGSHTRSLGHAPWWVWFGGFFGAFYVTVATIAVPRIGAVPIALGVLAGQVGISLVLDQWGLLGFKQHAITPLRVAGVVLVATGVTLVRLF